MLMVGKKGREDGSVAQRACTYRKTGRLNGVPFETEGDDAREGFALPRVG